MRITIEMNEAEARSTTIRRETGGALSSEPAVTEEAPAQDGGPPPEGLLVALGAASLVREGGRAERLGTDAGGPPGWLVDVINGGAKRPA